MPVTSEVSGLPSTRVSLALGSTLGRAGVHQGRDHAAKGSNLLFAQAGALEEVAKIADHDGALPFDAQESARVQRVFEMFE